MSGPRRLRRKADIQAEREAEQASQALATAQAQQDAAAAAALPATHEVERTRLDMDDLSALADMDPAELGALMEGSVAGSRNEVGDQVTGVVTRVGHDTVFVDVGGKSEGQIERSEMPDVAVGTEVVAYVLHSDHDGLVLSTRLSGAAATDHLDEAFASGAPVEGLVTGRNPGGFDVRIGDLRAFCPRSQISRLPATDPEAFVGRTLPFRVMEMEERRIVVSRRVIQEEEIAVQAEALWQTLEEGQQHRGTVRNVQPFGFFVDIGGIDGLVPRSEISWTRADPTDAVQIGQSVEVAVLQVDREAKRLTLSARALEDDPWQEVRDAFREGGVYRGTVVKLEAFGAFVELAPGVTGLAHVSKLVGGTPERGAVLTVRVLSIDGERRRIALSPVAEGTEATEADATPENLSGVVAEVLSNGVLVQLDDGRTGWLPAAEVELEPGTVLAQRFRRGKRVTGRLVRDDGNRAVLSVRDDPEAQRSAWRAHQAGGGRASGFGTLGDLLGGLDLKK